MFPTFSGSSRRPRHVDLSGQRNTNPWASSSWTPAQSGASKTVAQAQAERERRHREREELAAAKRLQRVWRGHSDRRQLRHLRRQEYDALYGRPLLEQSALHRLREAFPLLLAFLVPSSPDDQRRLDLFICDLLSFSPAPSSIDLSLFSPVAWDRLARLLARALEKRDKTSSQAILVAIADIVKERPASIKPVLKLYYAALARLADGDSTATPPEEQAWAFFRAVVAPLAPGISNGIPDLEAYQIFAYIFLAYPNLGLLQRNPRDLAQLLDLGALSRSIITSFSVRELPDSVARDNLLWLLAHFVALNRAVPMSRDARYLEALYLLMSFLAADIRARSGPQEKDDEYASDSDEDTEVRDIAPLSEYVINELQFLVNEDGIADLLARFACTASTTTHISEDTSLLAGYTLVLLRCFPAHADDIKMRLFQGDIKIVDGASTSTLPSVKFFWRAASKTNIFATIIQQSRGTEQVASVQSLLKPDPVRDLEWRTLLLFLELYNFLLRVTDDEDFLPREIDVATQQSQATQRIRASSLSLDDLKNLVNFLKHLAFPLYYNLPDIMRSRPPPSERLDAMLGVGPARSNLSTTKGAPSAIGGIIGMDVLGFREIVSSSMRALYERDSRRPFLPKDYWLMTSKFEMGGFISAVVLEELRNDDLSEDEEENDDANNPSTSSRNLAGDWLSRSTDRRRLRTVYSDEFRGTIGPRLEVLRNMPFAIPFEVRVQIFRQFVHLDKTKRRGGHVDPDRWRLAILTGENGFNDPDAMRRQYLGRHTATVSRGKEFDDAFDQFYSLGEGLKEPIQITFVDQFDQPEAGIDGGGVTKEFLTSVTNDAFSPERNGKSTYFVSNNQNLLYPNPSIFDDMGASLRSRGILEGSSEWRDAMNDLVKRYEFLGRIVGKCMYEGILIDISFAGFFLLKWASSGQSTSTDYRANLNDLRDLDPELYQGLMSLKNYPGDVADLSLDFTIADSVWDPSGHRRTITRPLRKDGANMPVTNKDRPLYISYVANHRLVAQQYRQTKAFLRGLGTIINPSWLSMFNQSELQRLIGGDSSEIDVEDLRRNTSYSGLYAIGDDGQEHPTIRFFWDVMRGLKDSERRDVLKYVTSTPRAPLLGFSQLKPQFSIRDGGTDQDRLPSTSTCVNLLKLPVYKSAETLRAKLLYAVQSGAGFDLS